jgi:hypothetical protein
MMKQGDLFKKIGNILTELQDQYQHLASNPQDLNDLELELFLSNANFLTDHIHIVMKVNQHREVKALETSFPEREQTHSSNAVLSQEPQPAAFEFMISKDANEPKFEFEEKGVDEIFNRPLTEEEQRIIAVKQALKAEEPVVKVEEEEENGPEPFLVSAPVETVTEEPVSVEVQKVEPIPQDVIFTAPAAEQPLKLTLNERLANSRNGNVPADLPKPEISDLKQAISLNDKLLFIKDLFHGYSLAYAEAIDLINKMPDFNTADAFLQKNYAQKNEWQSKQDTVDRFYDFLHRRFPAK